MLTIIALLGMYFAMGKYSGAPIPLRVPARFTYTVAVALCFLAAPIVTLMPANVYGVLLLLQCADILINHSHLLLFPPFTQFGGRPSKLFSTPITRFLSKNLGNARVSGLPHPLETGLIHGFRTMGYCGGSMNAANAKFRNITDPNGSGLGHDWFADAPDDERVEEYQIKYAYRPLQPLSDKWRATDVPELWENTWMK